MDEVTAAELLRLLAALAEIRQLTGMGEPPAVRPGARMPSAAPA
jgi:hypothetical protein